MQTYNAEETIRKILSFTTARRLNAADKQELAQDIRFELVQAETKYGSKMTPALAYKIGRHLLADTIDKLVKQPLTVSIDDKPQNKDGEDQDMSPAEISMTGLNDAGLLPGVKTYESDLFKGDNPGTWLQALQDHMGELQQLVSTWVGKKRQVADAMLRRPNMTVREVEDTLNIPRTTASTYMTAIKNDFKKLLRAPAQVPVPEPTSSTVKILEVVPSEVDFPIVVVSFRLPTILSYLKHLKPEFLKNRHMTEEQFAQLPTEDQRRINDLFWTTNWDVYLNEKNAVTGMVEKTLPKNGTK